MSIDYEAEFAGVINSFVADEDVKAALADDLLKTVFYSGVVTGLTTSALYGKRDVEAILQMPMFTDGKLDA